ncbi:hypothetical protein NL676_013720 [Syzygium grande]|nr:hypothetical protein NL676_013720 [Syzygium grande]
MEGRFSTSLDLPFPHLNHHPIPSKFTSLFTYFNSLILPLPSRPPMTSAHLAASFIFSSTALSLSKTLIPLLKPNSGNSPKVQSLTKNLSVFERALISVAGGRIIGSFTYVCLRPLDIIKPSSR